MPLSPFWPHNNLNVRYSVFNRACWVHSKLVNFFTLTSHSVLVNPLQTQEGFDLVVQLVQANIGEDPHELFRMIKQNMMHRWFRVARNTGVCKRRGGPITRNTTRAFQRWMNAVRSNPRYPH